MDGSHGAGPARDRAQQPPVADGVYLDAHSGLGLIVRDLARALDAEVALLCVAAEADRNLTQLASWGMSAGLDGSQIAFGADGFIGRAARLKRATVQPSDPQDAYLAHTESGRAVTHVVAAPVQPFRGTTGVLCAGFTSDPPGDPTRTLWLAESYARLASLCLEDPDALDGLLPGGRVDGLTGCLTQAAFTHELNREIARADRHGRALSCAFIDIDRFKRVNDRYGHLHGSRVLASIAAHLRAGIRGEDTLARYGGDEFVLLLPDTDEPAALELAERLRMKITTTMINLPHDPIDASIGVAEWRPGFPSQALLADADNALMAAKALGGVVITASGLKHPPVPGDPAQPDAVPPDAGTWEPVSVHDVLELVAYFESSGGASLELGAWELDADPASVASAWSLAIAAGLLTPAGTDPDSGEQMWRLSDSGRAAFGDTKPA